MKNFAFQNRVQQRDRVLEREYCTTEGPRTRKARTRDGILYLNMAHGCLSVSLQVITMRFEA
jgi:hypothetical protein